MATIPQPTNAHPLLSFLRSTIPHFPLSAEDAEMILSHFEEIQLDKGEFFLKQGKISRYFILTEGYLRSYTYNDMGDEITTGFYEPTRAVFEPASFFQRKPSMEGFVALTKCKGFTTELDRLNGLFHNTSAFREFGRAILVKEFAAYKERSLSAINLSAVDRYLKFIEQHKTMLDHIPLKQIASYLGITDTSLSRIRRELSKR
jgi:CRP-like cAMP-binding protein